MIWLVSSLPITRRRLVQRVPALMVVTTKLQELAPRTYNLICHLLACLISRTVRQFLVLRLHLCSESRQLSSMHRAAHAHNDPAEGLPHPPPIRNQKISNITGFEKKVCFYYLVQKYVGKISSVVSWNSMGSDLKLIRQSILGSDGMTKSDCSLSH